MPRISESEIARLKDEVSLVRLVEAAGVKLEKRGKDRVGCCPFHDDKTPSFVVSPDKNLWNCLGACGEGGDVIGFVQKLEGVSFRHAVELLRQDHAPEISASGPVRRSTTQKLEPFAADADDAAMLARVTAFYHATLKQSPEALDYLRARGLHHPDLIDTFSLGYANRSLGYRLPMKNRQAGAEIRGQLQNLGVLRKSGHEHLTGSLVVPITDEHGTVCQMYGRKIRDDLRKGTPTHLYLPGPHRAVWNLAGLINTEEVILCESLIDAMTFWCAGYRNVTCSYGVNGFTDAHREAFRRHDVRRVLIAYDRDAAGDAAAENHAKMLMADGVECFRILFPKGMDANAYALQVTPAPQSLGALIRSAEWMGSAGCSPVRHPPAGRSPVPCASGPKPEGLKPERLADRPEVAPEPAPQAETPRPAAKDKTPDTQPSSLAAEPETAAAGATISDEACPEIPDAPEAPCSPVPAGPAEIEAEVSEHEVAFSFGDRRWRVRGLERNTSYETLRINLLVSRNINGVASFHVDTLDLYAARQRTAYVREAAAELGLAKETVKADMARVLLKLEDLQDAQIKDALAPVEPVHEMTLEERTEAVSFLKRPDLLDAIAADAESCGVVGERSNLLVAYLAAVSRKLDKPLAVLVQSTSAAGKSALMDAVLAFLPEEDQVSYAAMTGQALFYLGETALKRKVLAIAEEEGARDAAYALKLLQSQGSLAIASTGKDPVTGKLVTQDYRIEGPMALMMTTTAIDLDEELKNRCLVLTVNETRDQTAAIHDRQRFEETLDGLMAKRTKDAILSRHQNAQRLLKPLAVVNPFAQHLTFLADKTRTRRDHGKYLALIRAIAVLHQHQREIRTLTGPDGQPVEYIEATLDDIAAANALAHEVLGRTLDELPPQTRALLESIRAMVETRCEGEKVSRGDYRFTRREVRAWTGWGLTQLKIHLKRLEEYEYLIPHMGGRGRTYVYELAYGGEGDDETPFVMGLIDVEGLRQDRWNADGTDPIGCGYDKKKSGVEGNWSGLKADLAGVGRGEVGPKSAPGRAGASGENASVDGASQPAAPKAPPETRPGVSKPSSSYLNGGRSGASHGNGASGIEAL